MTDDTKRRFSDQQKLLFLTIMLSALAGLVIGLLRKRGMDGAALLYIGLQKCCGD